MSCGVRGVDLIFAGSLTGVIWGTEKFWDVDSIAAGMSAGGVVASASGVTLIFFLMLPVRKVHVLRR